MSQEQLVTENIESLPLNTPLTSSDKCWLEALGCVWPDEASEALWLTEANQLVTEGSIWIKQAGEVGSQARTDVLDAREAFLDLLTALNPETREAVKAHSIWTMPLDTVVDTQRVLYSKGVDVATALNGNPLIIGYAPQAVGEKIDTLTRQGIDPIQLIASYPTALNFSPQSVVAKVNNLSGLGINASKAINMCPALLTYAPETLAEKVEFFTSNGLDVTKVVNELPQLLNLATESLTVRINNLSALGIDAVKAINTCPIVLGFAPDSVKEKIDNLAAAGINAAKAVNTSPSLLGLSPDTVNEKLQSLEGLGLKAVKLVNTYPVLLSLALDSITDKLNNLSAHGIDAVRAANGFPVLLGYAPESVNKKLTLIYSLARAWDIEDYRTTVNDIVAQWPVILGYKPDRLRTLSRIVSSSLPQLAGDTVPIKNIREIVINNLEATLAGYLENKDQISEAVDIRRIGQRYRALGKSACLDIIAAHQDDPVVKVYLRGYPLPAFVATK